MARLPFNVSKAVNTWKEVSANTSLSANFVLAGDQRLVALAHALDLDDVRAHVAQVHRAVRPGEHP